MGPAGGRGRRHGLDQLTGTAPWMLLLLLLALTAGQTAAPEGSGMTTALQTIVLSVTNNYRRMVKANNMLKLRWSPYLEGEAAAVVNQCVFKHNVDPVWGENIYRSEFDRPQTAIVITGLSSWNLERSFAMGDSQCCDTIANTTLCCNYQQMVWAQTRDIGCALKKCPVLSTESGAQYDNAWFFACYYSPRGNIAGFKPYTKGVGCSACPFTYDQCDKNLCTPSAFCKGDL